MLRDVMILHGCGVGGGSLVYANTLLVPPDKVFADPRWSALGNWKDGPGRRITPTAKRMLGVTTAPCQTETDHMLHDDRRRHGRRRDVSSDGSRRVLRRAGQDGARSVLRRPRARARRLRRVRRLHGRLPAQRQEHARQELSVPGRAAGRASDSRNAKCSTFASCRAAATRSKPSRSPTGFSSGGARFAAAGIVLSGGVLGTVPLLLKCRERGSLPRLSDGAGHVRADQQRGAGRRPPAGDSDVDYSRGIAIASGFSARAGDARGDGPLRPGPGLHVAVVHGAGRRRTAVAAPAAAAGEIVRHPLAFLRSLEPVWLGAQDRHLAGHAVVAQLHEPETAAALVLAVRASGRFGLGSRASQVPKYFPIANDIARRLADKMRGRPDERNSGEVLFNLTSTAHILGGCPMGADASRGRDRQIRPGLRLRTFLYCRRLGRAGQFEREPQPDDLRVERMDHEPRAGGRTCASPGAKIETEVLR